MYCYRITKYNPTYRGGNGVYYTDEWTSISEIGKTFNGVKLDFETYKIYEDAYIQSIHIVMNVNNITSLQVQALEQRHVHTCLDMKNKDILKFTGELKNEEFISGEKLDFVVRLILREMMWCKLINEQAVFIHFGYDYYMYIGSNKKLEKKIMATKTKGLFIEKFQSPYL